MARARKTISPDPFQKQILKKLSPEESRPGELKEFMPTLRAEFDLVSSYSPAGDQPLAIDEITRAFSAEERFQ